MWARHANRGVTFKSIAALGRRSMARPLPARWPDGFCWEVSAGCTIGSMARLLSGSMAPLLHCIRTAGSMAGLLLSALPARWPDFCLVALPARWPLLSALPARWPDGSVFPLPARWPDDWSAARWPCSCNQSALPARWPDCFCTDSMARLLPSRTTGSLARLLLSALPARWPDGCCPRYRLDGPTAPYSRYRLDGPMAGLRLDGPVPAFNPHYRLDGPTASLPARWPNGFLSALRARWPLCFLSARLEQLPTVRTTTWRPVPQWMDRPCCA
jgi:hypothetical protein